MISLKIKVKYVHSKLSFSSIIKLEQCIEMRMKKPEAAKESMDIILPLVKDNNVISCDEQVRRSARVEYELLLSFLATNVRFKNTNF